MNGWIILLMCSYPIPEMFGQMVSYQDDILPNLCTRPIHPAIRPPTLFWPLCCLPVYAQTLSRPLRTCQCHCQPFSRQAMSVERTRGPTEERVRPCMSRMEWHTCSVVHSDRMLGDANNYWGLRILGAQHFNILCRLRLHHHAQSAHTLIVYWI